MTDRSTPKDGEDRVSLAALDAETALRALLAVNPDDAPSDPEVRVQCGICGAENLVPASKVRDGRAPCFVCGEVRPVEVLTD